MVYNGDSGIVMMIVMIVVVAIMIVMVLEVLSEIVAGDACNSSRDRGDRLAMVMVKDTAG